VFRAETFGLRQIPLSEQIWISEHRYHLVIECSQKCHNSTVEAVTSILPPRMEDLIEQLFKAKDSSTIKDLAQLHSMNVTLVRNSRKQTLLHAAAGYGRTNLASYLIAKGADVNAQDIEGQAPLHNAACHGHFTVSSKLIESGADVNMVDYQGWSPLHFALARKDNTEKICPLYWKVIKLLLESGASPYVKSISGRSCLARIKNPEDKRAVILIHLLTQLKSCHGDKISRERIVDKYLDISDFFELVKSGDDNIDTLMVLTTARLLASRLVSCDNITPLHRAAGYNHLEVAKFFIDEGARVDATDSFGRIPLHNAAQYGHLDMIELLVNERSDINKQDLIGYSPLHVAASNRTFAACLKLIELGANVNSKCLAGKYPYDLAESDDVREVLRPGTLKHQLEVVPSTSDQAIYIDMQNPAGECQQMPPTYSSLPDDLMLDSSSNTRLFANTSYTIKKVILHESDWRFKLVKKRMLDSIMVHNNESGGRFTSYEILSIELILHEKVWSKYRLMCQRLEIDYGTGSKNEKLLFHGSNFVDNIQTHGFDERYAQRNGMFGAGIYFAKHSSKSNQYTFGWGQGCQDHMDKSCYVCERKMIYAQVSLGRSLVSKEAMPDCAHAPPGYSSVTGSPESTDNLVYPEYVIYSGDQAYPLFVISYKIKQ